MAHRVTLIPGDGTGPELTEATRRVLEATGTELEWDVREAGADVMEKHGGNPLPPDVLDAIRETGVALKGPITTPVGGGFRSVNVALRKELDMYAQVRPCKSYAGVRSRFDDVDLIIVRENTEDLYAGIEYEQGTPEAAELIEWIEAHGGSLRHNDAGISIKPISVTGTRRIFEFAFDYARSNGRRKVTAVHKANIMKFTDGLWLARRARGRGREHGHRVRRPDRRQHVHAARAAARGVRRARAAEPVRRRPLRPRRRDDRRARRRARRELRRDRRRLRADARLGAEVRRPEQGQPDRARCCRAMLMLRHLDERDAADRLEAAIAAVIAEGKSVTYDMKPNRDDPTAVGTSEVADAIIEKLEAEVAV